MLKFLKKNGYYVMLAVCVICIATVIAVAVTSNNQLSEMNKPKVTPSPVVVSPSAKPSASPKPVLPTSFTLPVTDATVGLDYSAEKFVFSETLNQWQTHTGIDFKTREPQDVFAICDGTVEKVITDDILNGGTVVIAHEGGLKTVYKSLGSEIPVKVGDVLKAGDKIGLTSMSAYSEFKDGAHLHLEMTLNDEIVDPNEYLTISK